MQDISLMYVNINTLVGRVYYLKKNYGATILGVNRVIICGTSNESCSKTKRNTFERFNI
jgi:hypothetical protein